MADVLLVLIVVSQAALYLLIGYLFRTLNRKHRDRNTSDLQRALITRQEEATGEHRVDIATLDAEEEVSRCRVCAFANTQRFKFCVLCGEKLKLSPTEMVRVRNSLTARQVRVRRRTEWQRQIKRGEVFCHQEISQECFQYPGYVVRFRKKDNGGDTAAEIEVAAALQDGEPGSIIMMLQSEIRLMQIEAFPAEGTNGLEFATGSPSSRNVDVEGLIALSKDDFPTKFAHFVTCTSSLIVPAELEVLKLF